MKYFTPELYLQFNSSDRTAVQQAHDQWEAALAQYQDHLKRIAPQMTEDVKRLAASLCLHDANFLGLSFDLTARQDTFVAMLNVRQGATDMMLVYLSAQEPLIEDVKPAWPYSRENVHWLYDEFDAESSGIQKHHILLSNGRMITLRFYELAIIRHDFGQRSAVA